MSSDMISKLPQHIIEKIMCLLDTDETARTSILKREWRYKWTTIPKLGLEYVTSSAARQVLLLHNGPVHELSLKLEDDNNPSDIDQILLWLSNKREIKSLTLEIFNRMLFSDLQCYKLPLFVCNGFDTLTTLSLKGVAMTSETLLQFLSNCPLLKNLSLYVFEDDFLGHNPTMAGLFSCLRMIESLTITCDTLKIFVSDLVQEDLPTTLIHLKYVCLKQVGFCGDNEFLAALIKCSPNLKKIVIDFGLDVEFEDTETNILEEHYSDVRLEHLTEFEYHYYSDAKLEFDLVSIILARSPKLKRVSIHCHSDWKDQESEVLETLLQIPCASPVKINVWF